MTVWQEISKLELIKFFRNSCNHFHWQKKKEDIPLTPSLLHFVTAYKFLFVQKNLVMYSLCVPYLGHELTLYVYPPK